MHETRRAPGEVEDVVEHGFCIGCGTCAALDPSIRMERGPEGRYSAVLENGKTPGAAASRCCPFADGAPNEDALGEELFGNSNGFRDAHAGFHLASFAGWVEEDDFRKKGSSGGLASWILAELLRKNMVDHVINVAPATRGEPADPLFRFTISSSEEEVRANAKSRYYPVEMSGVIAAMMQRPGRFAVVGLPCFIKALRLAARTSAEIRDRLEWTVGIVCGHLKSAAFAESLAWQCGVHPDTLRAVDFRAKLPDRPASRYGMTVEGLDENGAPRKVTRPMAGLFGGIWGHGFFKYKACDFCDDVLAETADIVCGDAWLPEYANDSRGTNVVVVRDKRMKTMLESASAEGRLHLDPIPVEKVVESQAGGFRHRREGLAYRLWMEDEAGRWRPTKRVAPNGRHLDRRRRRIYRQRYELGQASHAAFVAAKEGNDFGAFERAMKPLVRRYERNYAAPVLVRVLRRLKRCFSARPPKQRVNPEA